MRRTIVRLKRDRGVYIHFTREKYQNCLENIVNATGPMISMLDNGTLQSNTHGSIQLLSKIPPAATVATIVPGLKSSSLFSLVQLCDNGYNVLLNK